MKTIAEIARASGLTSEAIARAVKVTGLDRSRTHARLEDGERKYSEAAVILILAEAYDA